MLLGCKLPKVPPLARRDLPSGRIPAHSVLRGRPRKRVKQQQRPPASVELRFYNTMAANVDGVTDTTTLEQLVKDTSRGCAFDAEGLGELRR